MKALIIINFLALLIACNPTEKKIIEEVKKIPFKDRFSLSWKEPSREDITKLSPIIYKAGISCGEYQIKSAVGNDDFLIACTSDGKWWNFYVYNSSLNIIESCYEKIENPY